MVFEFFSPGIPQICKNAGAEFVLFDMEHTGLGFETLKTQFALCRGLGIVPMVRVPRGEYHFIARALDVGAMGVMIPMVGSAEEARQIVACTRYPPAGRRGAAFGFAHDDYPRRRRRREDRRAPRRTMVIPQIETAEGLRTWKRSPRSTASTRSGSATSTSRTSSAFPALRRSALRAAVTRIIAACDATRRPPRSSHRRRWAHRYANRGFRLFAYGSIN
jgi:hypothetical protein